MGGGDDLGQDGEGRDVDLASTIWLPGVAKVPSWFDPGRYQPLDPASSRLAWLLGFGGLLIPLLSVGGVVSGYHSARRGNRLGGGAIVWCVLTASFSIVVFGSLYLGDTWRAPTTWALEASDMRVGARPPQGLGFAASMPTGSYAELDLAVSNRSSNAVSFSPSTLEVTDGSGGRLAWATDDEVFLGSSAIDGGSTLEVHLWVALPSGRSIASISVGDSEVEL